MGDRVKADIEDLMKIQKEQTDLLQELRTRIDTISEITEGLISPGSETDQDGKRKRIQAEDALAGLTAGCRELQELLRFEEHAVGEYREAEAEAASIIEDLF